MLWTGAAAPRDRRHNDHVNASEPTASTPTATTAPGAHSQVLPRPLALPDFPWDSLRPYRARAAEHPGGVVDLAVGTPVDPTPEVARTALAQASNAPGYPPPWAPPGCGPPSSSGWPGAAGSRA